MSHFQARLKALKEMLYEERASDHCINVHQLVAGRSWVLVGKGGRRTWLKFYDHRDRLSLRVIDVNGNAIVIQRRHVLEIWTLTDDLVKLKC